MTGVVVTRDAVGRVIVTSDGPQGPANELAIGEVTAAPIGGVGSATITGQPPHQVLNLVYPPIPGLGTAAPRNVPASGNAAAAEVVLGADSRLSDARTPVGHAASHGSAGSDAVTIAESQVTGLVTDLAAKAAAARTITAGAGLTGGGSLAADRTLSVDTTWGDARWASASIVGNLLSANVASGTDTLGTTAGFTATNATLSRDTSWSSHGSGSLKIVPTLATTSAYVTVGGTYSAGGIPVTPGQQVTAYVVLRTAESAPAHALVVRWFDAGGVGTSVGGAPAVTPSATPAIARHTWAVPATAVSCCVMLWPTVAWGGTGSGHSLNVDDWGVWIGAGGDWAMPGVPIRNLGQRTNPLTGALEYWDSVTSTWVVNREVTRQAFSNADVTCDKLTRFLGQTGTMTASRTVTLPLASSVAPGTEIVVADESGTVTATNTIVIARAGSDTINGAASMTIAQAYGARKLYSNGSTKWSVDGGVLRASNNLADVASASTTLANIGAAPAARTITAGAGLTGGGSLAADRTLDVGAGVGISVGADAVSVDTTWGDARWASASIVGNLLSANQASIETDTTGFGFWGGAAWTRSTAQSAHGTASLLITMDNAAGGDICTTRTAIAGMIPVSEGQTYTAHMMAKQGTGSRTVRLWLGYYSTSNGTTAVGYSSWTAKTIDTTAFRSITNTVVIPAGVDHVCIVIGAGSGGSAGDSFYVDCLGFWQGAGGDWAMPGVPIPNLGQRTNPLTGALEYWDSATSTWVVNREVTRQAFSNADVTCDKLTRFLGQTGTMTASRTVTLPLASSVAPGTEIVVADESGTVTATNTIVIARAGSDTINGAASMTIAQAYGARKLYSNGSAKWSVDGGVLRASNNLADISSASTTLANIGAAPASTVGNLLSANQASAGAALGTTAGFTANGSTHSLGSGTLVATATSAVDQTSITGIPVTGGDTYTARVLLSSDNSTYTHGMRVYWFRAGGAACSPAYAQSSTITLSVTPQLCEITAAAPADAATANIMVLPVGGSTQVGDRRIMSQFGFWRGAGGDWALPGVPIVNLGRKVTHPNTDDVLVQEWDAGKLRWQMTHYDSGWRNIVALLDSDGATKVQTWTTLRCRRANSRVRLLLGGTVGTGTAASTTSSFTAVYMPTGFQYAGFVAMGGAVYASSYPCAVNINYGNGRVQIQRPIGTTNNQWGSGSIEASIEWETDDAIPTSLPGTLISAAPYA